MAGKAKEKAPPPDHLRCNRTDGRQWRCIRRALDGKKLCEIHYLQGRHRQFKRKVPDSLKLERRIKFKNKSRKSIQIRASNSTKITRMPSQMDNKEKKRCVSEVLDEALKKMKLKRGDLQLELIRVFLKRQVEKKKEKKEKQKEIEKENESDDAQEELELPNAVMAISTSKIDNAGDEFDIKLGLSLEGRSNSFSQRHFRSKNIEPAPIATMQRVPFAGMVKKKRMKCHWCRTSDYRSLIKCLNCRRQFFCVDCIKQRCFEEQEINIKCPVCRGFCSCSSCVKVQYNTTNHKEFFWEKRKVDKIQLFQYLIYMLLPVLAQINQDQSIELEMEAKITGKADSDMLVQQAETSHKLYCCSKCKTSIMDYHRSCVNCSYNLCLSCCWEFHRVSVQEGLPNGSCREKTRSSDYELQLNINTIEPSRMSIVSPIASSNLEAGADGTISCPANFGGCGGSLLQLRCVFPFRWTKDLEVSAAEMLCSYNFPKSPDDSSCSLCKEIEYKAGVVNLRQEVARRVDAGDNFLYCPTLQDIHEENLEHFQEHWSKGHPVIVRNVLRSTSDLTWDPVAMFCDYLEKRSSASQNGSQPVKGTNCLDWCEIEIANRQTFMGSLEARTHAHMHRKTIKFNAWLSSHLFQENFPAHYVEALCALPLQEYMNPTSGLLNLAVKLPGKMLKPELGPCIYISYGGPEELMQTEFLTKLCNDSCDVVNILAYATDDPISDEQLGRIKNLMKKYKAQDFRQSTSNSTNQKEKSSLHSEDTEESGLQDMCKEGLHLPNGIARIPFHSVDSLKGQMSSSQDGNTSCDSEHESESDSEVSILCSGGIEGSEDSEDKFIFQDDMDCSTSSPEKQMADSCGAQWDIFRRQDVPKLLEYLRRHSKEFSSAHCYSKHVVHPILDQNFFLDAFHKLRLKEEFDIQPWTFEQHPGEAIIIPAGCPYQIKKLKSCVNIVLDFISPESANECINLSEEIRLLPLRHKAKGKMLEVKKMALYGISAAIAEIRDHMHAKATDELMDNQRQS